MITRIKKNGSQYEFIAGRCRYKCADKKSLVELRVEFLQQQVSVKVK